MNKPKRKTQNWIVILLIAAGVIFMYWLFKTQQSGPSDRSVQESEQVLENDKALDTILAEPKVKDAVITDADVLYASVLDDGTRRDGYAEYLCQVLGDYKTSVKRVKVVKYNSTNDPDMDNAYGVLLGEATCR